jgi:predicted lipoprotein with Yx(FWY)xxD motif
MSNLEIMYLDGAHPARHAWRRSAVRVAICTSLAALALAAFPALAAAITGPPIVETNPAVQVAGGFDLKGTINPYGLETHYHFEYGTTMSYGANAPVPDGDAGSGIYNVPVSQTVTGLQPNTTYHFRLVATNSDGPGTGADGSFTTPADPNAPPPSTEPESGQNQNGSGQTGKARVKELRIKDRTILTTANGHTLYSLSAEKNGKFICTKASGCLALWHPLLVPHGTMPKGPVKLGTIKRPEGGIQVTFHGRPLYSFAQDMKPGQVKGEGLKDVGTWHPATVSKHKR